VSLKTRLADELPAILGDRVQLQQVVLNLILNAIEGTREIEGRSRQVWIRSLFDGGKDVHVEVRDSGIGLTPDSRKRLFEAFYTTKKSGLGMGLSITKSIIEAHGGRISARPNSPTARRCRPPSLRRRRMSTRSTTRISTAGRERDRGRRTSARASRRVVGLPPGISRRLGAGDGAAAGAATGENRGLGAVRVGDTDARVQLLLALKGDLKMHLLQDETTCAGGR
jgi:hypothetical protein